MNAQLTSKDTNQLDETDYVKPFLAPLVVAVRSSEIRISSGWLSADGI